MAGMAQAFGIGPRTALGITTAVSALAVTVPLFMLPSLGALSAKASSPLNPSPAEAKGLSYLTLICGFFMAWNIGANDVANAMGTSVGSGALTLRQAVMTAAVLEFAGAFLVGSHVSHTMQKGIVNAAVFHGRDSLLFSGLLASLAAAGTWLQVHASPAPSAPGSQALHLFLWPEDCASLSATCTDHAAAHSQVASFYGWPVSTTHCIVGALVGFGIVYGGSGAVYWASLARVVASWVVSPLMGATVAFLAYKCIRTFVYSAANPGRAAARAAPVAVFLGVAVLGSTSFSVGGRTASAAALRAVLAGALGAGAMHLVVQRQLGNLLGDSCDLEVSDEERVRRRQDSARAGRGPTGTQLQIVYGVFGCSRRASCRLLTAPTMLPPGPISAALAILNGAVSAPASGGSVATSVLAWGGFGIVAGLVVWGYRVIATIGEKITELTPTRGFSAEFAAASVVVFASRLGLPISATHTLVGAVMGVGFARGLNSVRVDVVKEIVASWLVTIPIGAMLSVLYTFLFSRFIPAIL
eukprot:SM000095S25016  [mRNA]  locus=s95:472757:474830:- [translate_table: standard]